MIDDQDAPQLILQLYILLARHPKDLLYWETALRLGELSSHFEQVECGDFHIIGMMYVCFLIENNHEITFSLLKTII